MKFNVTEVEFDFDDDYAEESKLTLMKKSKFVTLHLEYGMQTMKMILSKKSLPLVGGASNLLTTTFNSNEQIRNYMG